MRSATRSKNLTGEQQLTLHIQRKLSWIILITYHYVTRKSINRQK